jgi:hypothetical protein
VLLEDVSVAVCRFWDAALECQLSSQETFVGDEYFRFAVGVMECQSSFLMTSVDAEKIAPLLVYPSTLLPLNVY